MKKFFQEPEFDVEKFAVTDVITASEVGCGEDYVMCDSELIGV